MAASSRPLLLFLLSAAICLGLLSPLCAAANILNSGESLYSGQSLTNGRYRLTMQPDCNLVLYDGRAIWASGTNGRGSSCRAAMQSDGNFVVYSGAGRALWASNTYRGRPGNYVLVLQADRNLVIYGDGRAIWATGTKVGAAGLAVDKSLAPGKDVTTEPAAAVVGGDKVDLGRKTIKGRP